jgi:MtN3 and saliva related transmembrane protein
MSAAESMGAVATELIGWLSAVILLGTIGRQVYAQWRAGTSQGVSRWLFIGQLVASSGFVVYSWLLANWVFVVTNVLMLVTALLGQWLYRRNQRRDQRPAPRPTRGPAGRNITEMAAPAGGLAAAFKGWRPKFLFDLASRNRGKRPLLEKMLPTKLEKMLPTNQTRRLP